MLLRWAGAVLRHLDPEAAKKAVTRVIECQAACLETLAAARGSSWGPAQRAVDAVLRAKPALFKEYLEVSKAKGERSRAGAAWHGSHG